MGMNFMEKRYQAILKRESEINYKYNPVINSKLSKRAELIIC